MEDFIKSNINQVIQQLPVFIVIADQEFRFRYISKTLEGVDKDKLIGQSIFYGVPDEEIKPMKTRYRKLLKDNCTFSFEIIAYVNDDGEKGWFRVNASRLEDGKKKYIMLVSQVITEEKHHEGKLKAYTDNLESLVKERTLKLEELTKSLESKNSTITQILKTMEEESAKRNKLLFDKTINTVMPFVDFIFHKYDIKEAGSLQLEKNIRNVFFDEKEFNHFDDKYYSLSKREKQVYHLIEQNKTSKEIASFLGLSSLTVDRHRNNIRKKLGLVKKGK